jgi:hypothetical protein
MLLQAEEARDVPGAETVSWFVINRQLEGDRYVQRTKKVVTHKAKKLKFDITQAGDEEIGFFAAMQTSHGMNTAGLRY